MIAASIAFLLHPLHWFSETAADPLWRWPLGVWVVSASALITYPIEKAWKRRKEIKDKRSQERQENQREQQRLMALSETLLHLTPGEKQILKEFVSANSKVRDLEAYGDAASLAHQGFLVQIGEIALRAAYYRIDDDVWAYLLKHPESLN
jgi:hypothetical protein